MTPYEVAQRLMRQRNGTTGHPDFIVAYLEEETRRHNGHSAMVLSPNPFERMADHFKVLRLAIMRLGASATYFPPVVNYDDYNVA